MACVRPSAGADSDRRRFLHVETVWLQRLYVLFFIELASRRVHLAGCTAHPDSQWVTQHGRQVAWTVGDRAEPPRFLIRDHDRKFTRSFDAVFQADGVRIVRTPIQAPQAVAFAEVGGLHHRYERRAA